MKSVRYISDTSIKEVNMVTEGCPKNISFAPVAKPAGNA